MTKTNGLFLFSFLQNNLLFHVFLFSFLAHKAVKFAFVYTKCNEHQQLSAYIQWLDTMNL